MSKVLEVLQEFLLFPEDLIENYKVVKNRKKFALIPPIQTIAKFNNIEYEVKFGEDIEDIKDNKVALRKLWDMVFPEGQIPEGKVLFYSSLNELDKAGIICDSKELKQILFLSYNEIFGRFPLATMEDFYFLFTDLKLFYGFEHPGFSYSFAIGKRNV